MSTVRFYKKDQQVPLEMHKVRVVQKLFLPPVEERVERINEAGNNTFLLQNRDVFMDMLTDSGVNAMSDNQMAAMMQADDSYAGSETCNRVVKAVREVFGVEYFLPAHQGRACENILAEAFVMATKWFSDGDVHSYFNPYGSAYEAFINYMNVLADFEIELSKAK